MADYALRYPGTGVRRANKRVARKMEWPKAKPGDTLPAALGQLLYGITLAAWRTGGARYVSFTSVSGRSVPRAVSMCQWPFSSSY